MGATASTATVVKYELTGGKSSVSKLTVMGTGFDRNLGKTNTQVNKRIGNNLFTPVGGAHVDKLLATHLAVEFEREQAAKMFL